MTDRRAVFLIGLLTGVVLAFAFVGIVYGATS